MLEGLAVAGLANAKISCSSIETLQIPLPSESGAQTCGEYLASYVNDAGGQVLNPLDNVDCQYCPYHEGNSILVSFGMDLAHAWRNAGLMVVYVCFNILAIFGIYWAARVPKKWKFGK